MDEDISKGMIMLNEIIDEERLTLLKLVLENKLTEEQKAKLKNLIEIKELLKRWTKMKLDNLIQLYLKGKTSRRQEKELINYLLKDMNFILIRLQEISDKMGMSQRWNEK